MTANESTAVTDSPWFWVLLFSLMALGALAAMSGKYGRRQTQIERQYQARERTTGPAAAENNPDPDTRNDRETRRDFASPDNTLIPLWPLAALLTVVAVFAGAMLLRTRRPLGSPADDNSP